MPMNGIFLHSEHQTHASWQPAGLHLPASDIATAPTVWSVPVSANARQAQSVADILSPEEINKGLRFHQARHRTRFLLGRAVLRQLLGQALALPPQAVRFKLGTHNKPLLEGVRQPLSFNLSYTEDHVIIAIDPTQAVGIDIERIKTDFDYGTMVDACFSPREIEYIGDAHGRFYSLWTRKEALLKLSGKGIGEHLPSVEVLDGPGIATRDNVGDTPADRLRLYTFEVQPMLLASLATARPYREFSFYRWQEENSTD